MFIKVVRNILALKHFYCLDWRLFT